MIKDNENDLNPVIRARSATLVFVLSKKNINKQAKSIFCYCCYWLIKARITSEQMQKTAYFEFWNQFYKFALYIN